MDRGELVNALKTYRSSFAEELPFRDSFLELLKAERCFYRDYLPGHITGSAFIIDEDGAHVLLTHHAKLNKWLQPGGHADGDEDVLRVALREAEEETGLVQFKVLGSGLFDIDVHTIPARGDFPEHQHYDVRFLLQASRKDQLVISGESHDLAWKPIHELARFTGNDSIARMAAKVESLKLKAQR
jgi:8-oxo-dGTP pyrophosphatase MutT (NUDIX family)